MASKLSSHFLIFIALLILTSSVAVPDELCYTSPASSEDSAISSMDSWVDFICDFAADLHSQLPGKKHHSTTSHHRHFKKTSAYKIYDAPVAFLNKRPGFTASPLPAFQPGEFANFKKDILSPPPQQA